jgi:2-phosphosulfolactate phosphatase
VNIEICFTAQELSSPLVYGKTIILLDIFRASSTIITALFNGANNIIPASSLKNALELKKKYPQAILGGEDHGQMVKGFILGNSPLEYTTDIVKNKTVILSTTNGTKTFHLVKDGIKNLYIGSFLNAPAVAKEIIEEENDVLLACAGTQDEYSLEDTCCAGYFLHLLKNIISPHIAIELSAHFPFMNIFEIICLISLAGPKTAARYFQKGNGRILNTAV